jgi:peroxiredoxin
LLGGFAIPYFSLTSIDGELYRLSELKGRVIMLNFWFIDCASCVDEIPLLNQLTEEYKDEDFLLLSFSTDDKETILNFKKSHELKYVVFENSSDLIQNTFHLPYGYPTNIILDKEGKIIDLKLGGDPKKLKATFRMIIDTGLMK